MYKQPTITDVSNALEALRDIERPEGDNENDPINGPSVYPRLAPEEQQRVDEAEEIVREYIGPVGEPNKRSLKELNKRGYDADMGPHQYDIDRVVGSLTVGDWTLDLSEPAIDGDDY